VYCVGFRVQGVGFLNINAAIIFMLLAAVDSAGRSLGLGFVFKV